MLTVRHLNRNKKDMTNHSTLREISIASIATYGGIWLILETMSYFGLKIIENSGPLGFLWLLTASVVIGGIITFSSRVKAVGQSKIANEQEYDDSPIFRVFRNKREASSHILDSVNSSSTVKILVGRGNELQRETYARIFESPLKYSSVKILLPDPEASSICTNWLEQREKEVMAFDKTFTVGTLIDQVRMNIKYVLNFQQDLQNFDLKLYNIPHLGLITITDDSVFFYFLKINGHGRDSKMYQCKLGSEYYNCLNRYFEEIWKISKNA